ncbi:MAG: hypothetical protein ACLP1Y_09045 [Candidatus Acidiferrales bacterium]
MPELRSQDARAALPGALHLGADLPGLLDAAEGETAGRESAEGAVIERCEPTGKSGGLTTGTWLWWFKFPQRPYWLMYMVTATEFCEDRAIRISRPVGLMLGMN